MRVTIFEDHTSESRMLLESKLFNKHFNENFDFLKEMFSSKFYGIHNLKYVYDTYRIH